MNISNLIEMVGKSGKKGQEGTLYYVDEQGVILAKKCNNCAEIKSLDSFPKKNRGLGNRESTCKACRSEYRKNYYEKNLDKEVEYRKGYYEENREVLVERARNYRKNNPDKTKEIRKKHYEKNRDTILERTRSWRKENSEVAVRLTRIWRNNNPGKSSLYNQIRKARKNSLPNDLTSEQYAVTLNYFGNACALTGQKRNLEKEHAIPLSIGHGGTTFENCYPMISGLNQSKYNHNIFEWFEANRQRFNLSQERFDRLIEWLGKANGMTVEEYRDYVYWCHANPRNIDEEVNEECAI